MNECIQFLIRYRYLFLFDIISNKCKGCFIFVNLVSVYESDCLYLDHVHIITCISSGGNLPIKLLVLIAAATFEFSIKFLTLLSPKAVSSSIHHRKVNKTFLLPTNKTVSTLFSSVTFSGF